MSCSFTLAWLARAASRRPIRTTSNQRTPTPRRRAETSMSQAARSLNTRAVTAAVIGNALEWYDFTVFGFLTVVIAELFFPSSSDYASILLTTATFGVAFCMRPVGGIVLGLYADRAG